MLSTCLMLSLLFLASGCRRAGGGAGSRVDYSKAKATVNSEQGFMTSCPVGMVLVPAGPMLYGPTEEKSITPPESEAPQRLNTKAFCMDKYEYPNQPGESPMRSVSWLEAKNLCSTKGKRLCSEYEFEKACRGSGGTRFTYGDGFFEGACPNSAQDYGLGQFSNCVSGFGVHDLGGGVYEWSASVPAGEAENTDLRVLRGGMSEDNTVKTSRCTYRVRYAGSNSGREIGFRCCGSPVKEELAK